MQKLYKIITENMDGTKSEYIVTEKTVSGKEKNIETNHKFDFCVKKSFETSPYMGSVSLKKGQNFCFFIKKYNTIYDRYFSKDMKLEELLSEEIQECYAPKKKKKTTSGNEFSSGKFYSVASSSRLAVSSFTEERDSLLNYIKEINLNGKPSKIKEIEFEHDTPITGISEGSHCPQLDVFMKTNNATVFVEVKNHEILDSHKSVELSPSYMNTKAFKKLGLKEELSTKIKKDKYGNNTKDEFITLKNNTEKNRFLLAEDYGCELKTFHFDFKQFLCHLMGILSYAEKHPEEEIYFYYLVYKNELFVYEYRSKLYDELEAEVKAIFDVFSKKFPKIHFGLCYNDKYDTLQALKTII